MLYLLPFFFQRTDYYFLFLFFPGNEFVKCSGRAFVSGCPRVSVLIFYRNEIRVCEQLVGLCGDVQDCEGG